MGVQNPTLVAGLPADFPITPVTAIPLTAGGTAVVVSGTITSSSDISDRAGRLLGIVYGSGGQIQQAADNSVDSTLKLPVINAVANAAAPTWTEGHQVPLSVDLAGNLRISASFSGAVNQGSPNTLANKWPVQITDGTNVMPTMDVVGRAGFIKVTDGTNTSAVKAASTAAIATDPSLVVAFSPNSPLPAGSAAIGSVSVSNFPGTQPISGTVTANQGTASANAKWSVQIDAPLGQTTMAASIPVTLASNQSTINVSVQNATLAVTQSTSPWVENISQFGGNPVVTGTGTSGVGIPRVTVSSDSFPATQPVSGTVTVTQTTASNLNATVIGTSSDNTANSTTKISVLSARANTSSPSWTEGNQVPLSSDLGGNLRTVISGPASTDAFQATVFAPGLLRVAQEPTQLFWDAFDTGLDLNKWATSSGGTGISPSNLGVDGGSTTLNGGTTLNSFSLLQSVISFKPEEPGYIYTTARVNIENPVLTTGYRFWGLGTVPSLPTIANPVIDGVGWEIGTNGHLSAVTYAGTGGTVGTRLLIKDLNTSGQQPTDSAAHKYFIWFRGDTTYWAIDSFDNIVASFTTGASGPNVNTLPYVFLVVSNGGTAETIIVNGAAVGDTGRNNVYISDATYPWKKLSVSSAGSINVQEVSGNLATIAKNGAFEQNVIELLTQQIVLLKSLALAINTSSTEKIESEDLYQAIFN